VPDGLHSFVAGFLRCSVRVTAYASILTDAFPPFGPGGSYPVVEIDPPLQRDASASSSG
jgi:hypothetical protein